MPHWEFAENEPIDLFVKIVSGTITVSAEPTDLITVDVRPARPGRHGDASAEEVQVDYTQGRLDVTEPARFGLRLHSDDLEVAIRVPAGSRCSADLVSAHLTGTGELGSLNVKSASGGVTATTVAADAQVSTISGKVAIGAADKAMVKTASGSIELGTVASELNAQSVSGRVRVGRASGPVAIRTSSGRIGVDALTCGQAEVQSISGGIRLNVSPGISVYQDLSSLSGKVISDLEPAEQHDAEASGQVALHLRCRTTSGPIRVGRAQPASQPS
jgi:DUF4097 and DUF4098 domain-containing protein YvlB